jgi:hypothetical protein
MHRLIYKSDSAAQMNWGVVGSILTKSTRNNERNGLTGALLLGKRHFLQVLEGDFHAVNETFQRISRDPRHRNIRLVSFEVIDHREFAGWEMRGVGVFDFDPPISDSLIQKYGEEDGELRFPEEGWLALSLVHDIFQLPEVPEWSRDRMR